MNVVPLVDVVLVLLIIFMVTASVMEFGLEVDVPKTKQTTSVVPEAPVVVSIAKGSRLYLADKEVTNVNLLVKSIHDRYPDAKEVYLRADKAESWEVVLQIMAVLGEAKLKVNAVTKPETVRRGQ
jgi:biopolymer transport protein ExbD